MKILIIEDNKKLAKSLKKGLEQEGFAADYLLTGLAGERRLEVNRKDYDLAILDLTLPDKDGVEVCKNLREKNVVLPIIMLTARDTVKDKILGLDSGADDYMVKPFSFEELISRIKALLRRPKQSLPNATTRRVFRNQKEIPLTLKEFGMLEYFMRQPNRVLTREQILDHLWDFDFSSFSNVVDVHIKNLRKKLGRDEKTLETIRGVGYRLNTGYLPLGTP